MLDLFSGLCGASSAMIKDNNWKVITVDNQERFNPTICMDILELEIEDLPNTNFDLIWASPPCNAFSMASFSCYWTKTYKTFLPKKLESVYYLNLTYRALWLINQLNPTWWFLENPKALLHKFIGKPSGWITFCQYGEKQMKPTHLWGKHPPSFSYKHCHYGSDCHELTPRGAKTGTQGRKSSEERAKIPYLLSAAIKKSVENPYATWFVSEKP